eukprot:3727101-Amphidinium_carterae.3
MVAAQQSLTPVWKILLPEVPKSRARDAWEALLVAVALPSKTECETDFAEKKATGMFAEGSASTVEKGQSCKPAASEKASAADTKKGNSEQSSGSDSNWDDWGSWTGDAATDKGQAKNEKPPEEGCWSWSKDRGWWWFTPPTMEVDEQSSSEDDDDDDGEEQEQNQEVASRDNGHLRKKRGSVSASCWERFGWIDGVAKRAKRMPLDAPWRYETWEGATVKSNVPPPPLPPPPTPPPPPPVRVATESRASQDVGAKAPWRMTKIEVPAPPPRPGNHVQVPMPPPPSAKHMQRGSSTVPTPPPPPRHS